MRIKVEIELDIDSEHYDLGEPFVVQAVFDHFVHYAVRKHVEDELHWTVVQCKEQNSNESIAQIIEVHKNWGNIIREGAKTMKIKNI